jgi:shikimate dehydrogenase
MIINSSTKLTLLFGNPVKHSKSPVFQNAAFEYMGINSVYIVMELNKNYFDQIISGIKKIDILGINITIPFKTDIIKHIDELSEDAKKINAVNTIEILDNKWIGHNTDWYGFNKTLETEKITSNHDVLVIGAGGAANGVIHGLQKYGFKNITITNRTSEKAKDITRIFNIDSFEYENLKKNISKYSFIVNTTSIDFKSILDSFDNDVIYYDLKYYNKKINTKYFIDGSNMLIYQGAKAFEIWTKKTAPVEIMKKSLVMKN